MARIDALSIELLSGGKDKLAEEYGKVIENIQARTLSAKLKNAPLGHFLLLKAFCPIYEGAVVGIFRYGSFHIICNRAVFSHFFYFLYYF